MPEFLTVSGYLYRVRGGFDAFRYSFNKEAEATRNASEKFTRDSVAFLAETVAEQKTLLSLNQLQEKALERFAAAVQDKNITVSPPNPTISYERGIPQLNVRVSSERTILPSDGIRSELGITYCADSRKSPIQSLVFSSFSEGNVINPILYYAFPQIPESQEALVALWSRKDCRVYGKGERIDVGVSGNRIPQVYRHFGSFASGDGNTYQMYGWNGDQAARITNGAESTHHIGGRRIFPAAAI